MVHGWNMTLRYKTSFKKKLEFSIVLYVWCANSVKNYLSLIELNVVVKKVNCEVQYCSQRSP